MIAIVGGGITGLALGWELSRLGADFVVLEASSEPGGVIRSAEVDGRILDWGPQRARLTKSMGRLVEALGLEQELVTAPEGLDLFVYRDGRLRKVPFSVAALLRTDLVGPGAKLRALFEPLTRAADPQERVATYFCRKFGRELYEALIGPLYGGLYGSDPADMEVGLSLIHVLREFGIRRSLLMPLFRRGGRIRPPPACTFRAGMQALPRALSVALGERLHLGNHVVGIEDGDRGWRVQLDGRALDVKRLVLTTPATVTARLLERAAPKAAEALSRLRYNPLAIVHLDSQTELRGLGFQMALTERDSLLRGVTFNDSLFGRRDLYTAYLGGSRHLEVSDMDESALAEAAVSEFRRCTGYDARALCMRHEQMPAWDITWKELQGFSLPHGIHVAANWWSRPGLQGRLTEAQRLAKTLAQVSTSDTTSARAS